MHPDIFLLSLLLAFLPAVLSGKPARPVGDGHEVGVHASDRPRTYIVHVQKPEHLMSAIPEVIEQWHKSFLPSPTLHSGEPRMVASYKVVMSGFAALLTAEEARDMESKEGFLHARPSQRLMPQTTHSPEFLGLRPDVWRDANRGEGAIIAVIDTGIDPDHDSFAGNPMPDRPAEWEGSCYFNNQPTCNDKLIGAAEFLESDHRVYPPYDEDGHGTHVAATIAGLEVDGASIRDLAAGTAAGAAPGAYLAVYKGDSEWGVLWSIEQAIDDGAHIISMSLGWDALVGPDQPPFYANAMAIGSLAAVRHGILVSCAACNEGPRPSSVCNDAPWIMTVGASTMDRALRLNLRLRNGYEIPGESLYSKPGLRGRLAYPGLSGDGNARFCTHLGAYNVRGKVVMCYPGRIETKQIADVVKKAGGVAVVLLSSKMVGSIIVDVPDTAFPTVSVNYPNSLKLIKYVNQSTTRCRAPRVELVPVGTVMGVTPAPAVPYFSSRGPSLVNGGILKPDIIGPGVNVLAAKTNSTSDFVLMSGTSMATPHLSGIAAIIKLHQLRQTGMEWTPAMIRSAIMTTAQTTNSDGDGITDETGKTADLFATGAGHVNPAGAMDPGLVYDIRFEDYVEYLCGLGYTDKQILRTASISVDCDQFGSIEPEQVNYPSIAVTLSDDVRRKVIKRTVTNVRSEPTSYTVEVFLPTHSGVTVSVFPRTLNFDTTGETKSFDVTFSALSCTPGEPGDTVQGYLKWVSAAQSREVTSPLLVTFA
ncbi:hypothetical protein Taro_016217 [Colocasia esculenta]|uniref:Uncharacterized protein n=1 Tax=Colocasia esculenta TaxID=4460 RepID=A0A843UDC0_COLES|nr:hypothetical protein [Colocasia esculenta]